MSLFDNDRPAMNRSIRAAVIASWTRPRRRNRRKLGSPASGLKISIESLNYQLRKIIKNRGHSPNDTPVVKLLWLSICNIEDKRARERAKEQGRPRGAKRTAEGRLVEGQITTNWKEARCAGGIVAGRPAGAVRGDGRSARA
jgi:hypothetical protein